MGGLAAHPTEPSTLFVALFGRGIFQSTNGGDNWESFNEGRLHPDVFSISISPTGQSFYAATGGGAYDYLCGDNAQLP